MSFTAAMLNAGISPFLIDSTDSLDPALSLYSDDDFEILPPYSPPHSFRKRSLSDMTDGEFTVGSTAPSPKRPATRSARSRPSSGTVIGFNPSTGKPKLSRNSRACNVCRRMKMKCIGAEDGQPCVRCRDGGHECIFLESNRGKRPNQSSHVSNSMQRMENTLNTILRYIGRPPIDLNSPQSRLSSPDVSPSASCTQALIEDEGPVSNESERVALVDRAPARSTSPELPSLPENTLNPLGLLAEASLAHRRMHNSGINKNCVSSLDSSVGVANTNYFKPGAMTILGLRRIYIERQIPPEMLNFVTSDEVFLLFNIYFEHINMHINVLDRNFHTPSLVCSRSPFLLTTICAISSRFYCEKPELYIRLMKLVNVMAFDMPAHGYKSVEIVQAYLLLTLWGCGIIERDNSWLLLGMALRMATDLNLHRKSTAAYSVDSPEGRARDIEVHNRERTWLVCYALDRHFSAQLGKPHAIKEDYIILNTQAWCAGPLVTVFDISVAAYVELQIIVCRALDTLNTSLQSLSGLTNYGVVIKTFETQILVRVAPWEAFITSDAVKGVEHKFLEYALYITHFYVNYSMLLLNSFGLQNASKQSKEIEYFINRCHTCAMTCLALVRDRLRPYLRYSPNIHCVQTTYAVLSLLKLYTPEFANYLSGKESSIEGIVQDIAGVLGDIAVSPTHAPAVYSEYLKELAHMHGQSPGPNCSEPVPLCSILTEFEIRESGPVLDIDGLRSAATGKVETKEGENGTAFDEEFWDDFLVTGSRTIEIAVDGDKLIS